jgi:streptogramin lyase
MGRKSVACTLASALVATLAVAPVPVMAATGDITEFTIPTANTDPQGIVAGPDGSLWFTEFFGNNIGRITSSGVITEFGVPTAGSLPVDIAAGPDGNLWFTEASGNKIGQITTSGVITEFPITGGSGAVDGITAGPDGNLWFTEQVGNNIARITTGGVITEFPIPTTNSQASNLATGSDGNLWFTEFSGNKIGRITPSGVITEFGVPSASSFPIDIAAGPDGNLWFTEIDKIGKITTSGVISEVHLPVTGSEPTGIAAGPDGALWFTEAGGNNIGRITTSGVITEYPISTANSGPIDISTGSDRNLWFTESSTNKIGRLEEAPAAVLPAMANAAYGGYTSVAQIQNVGSAAASVEIRYFDSTGASVGSGDSITNLPINGTWTVRQDNGHGLTSGQAGSAIVFSNQPVATFVNEFAPGGADATSYTGINPSSGSGSTLFAPAIANNAYGGYTTGIGLVNVGVGSTDVTVTYRDSSGAVVRTQTLGAVASGSYQGLFSGDAALALPGGFAGTATITSSVGALAAVVNETGPGGQFSSYDAVPAGSTTLFAPAALRNAYGGYNTGMGIQNTTGTAGTVTINYYDSSGTATTTTAPIEANGYVGVYQGTDIAADGAYTAKITSTVATAAIVNEVAPSSTSAKQSTAYNTFASGNTALYLPLVESTGSDGWSTGEGIMNTGTVVANVTVVYYDTSTGAMLGTPQNISLQPNAFWGLYQPTGGLPSGDRASAAVHTLGGQVAVICNESSATSFMSYNGQ